MYLSDDLYQRARARGLKLSALTQSAIKAALEETAVDQWIAEVSARPLRVDVQVDTPALIDQVRDEFGT